MRKETTMYKKSIALALAALLLGAVIAVAQSGEFVDTSIDKFGYAFKLPKEFKLDGKIDNTTTWMYQPSSVGGMLGGVAGIGGGKEPALTIYVNWVYMESTPSQQLFNINKKSDSDAIKAPNSKMKDLKVLTVKGGLGYWYKESDKEDPNEIHRWILKLFGNKSSYTVGLCGTYKQFEKWGPIYEEVINSFELIPLKGN
jgi:hypothetical protein